MPRWCAPSTIAERGARAGAILALVGFVNVPIVKFSVDWWNTLHQMGGYAFYVWSSYAVVAAVLLGNIALARSRRRRALDAIRRRIDDEEDER
jgi:heme exporter protein CcmD